VDGDAGDLVVGVAHRFFQQMADVTAADPIQHPTTLAVTFDESR